MHDNTDEETLVTSPQVDAPDTTSSTAAEAAQPRRVEPAADPEEQEQRATNFDRIVRGPLDDVLRQQTEILRRVTQPAATRFAAQQASILQAHSRSMAQDLAANITRQFQLPQMDLFKPYSAALDQLLQTQKTTFETILPAINLPKFTLPQFDISSLNSLVSDITRLLPAFKDLHQQLNRSLLLAGPPNWHDLDESVDAGDLLDLSEDGIPTAWVPRASVLMALVGADEADRSAVFDTHREEVLDDCTAVLSEITSAELADQVILLAEALAVAEMGHLAAAQSLAASIFDTTLRHTFEPKRMRGYYETVKNEIRDRHDNASMSELRWGIVHVPVLVVLNMFDPAKGDPVPSVFNRHASAHAAGSIQYTPTNAVVALALATSLLREAHQTLVNNNADDEID